MTPCVARRRAGRTAGRHCRPAALVTHAATLRSSAGGPTGPRYRTEMIGEGFTVADL